MHLTIKLFNLWWPFSLFYIIMTFFLAHIFHFLCAKHSVIISKLHNESILFLKLIHNF
jgi:hypothetical protein